jgi:hypothetical protein
VFLSLNIHRAGKVVPEVTGLLHWVKMSADAVKANATSVRMIFIYLYFTTIYEIFFGSRACVAIETGELPFLIGEMREFVYLCEN